MSCIVQLSDVDGKACRMKLVFPIFKARATPTNSTWQVIDEGFFTIRSGGCQVIGYGSMIGPGMLRLFFGKKITFLLHNFLDSYGLVNATGEGSIESEYCLGFKAGELSWALLE